MDLGPRTQEALHAALGRDERAQAIWQREDSPEPFWDEQPEFPGLEHYGFDGEPITMRVWAVLFESPSRLLAQEWFHVRDGVRVWLSTVWLGMDHNHMRYLREFRAAFDAEDLAQEIDTRPWIFETMLFKNAPGFSDVFARMGDELGQWRQATWEEALLQHAAIASSVAAGIVPSYGD